MGVWDGWFGRRSDDPLQDLDPKVREFLAKESPLKVESKKPAPIQEDQSKKTAQPTPTEAEAQKPIVPAASQFQDGRYAHIWKNYRPLSDVEMENKSDNEKMSDVLAAFRGRQAAIGAAALENCADEQFDWSNCMKSGGMTARMTLCQEQVRKFEQCYNMQKKLLKILGYLNSMDRSAEMDERIQLHADKLYHQWLEQDKAATEASKERSAVPNDEVPQQIVEDAKAAAAAKEEVEMTEAAKKRMQERLDKTSEREREMDKAAEEAEARSKKMMAERVQSIWNEGEVKRELRKQKGEQTIMDRVVSAMRGPNPSSGSDEKKD